MSKLDLDFYCWLWKVHEKSRGTECRPWNYLENSGIYSQLNRKSETRFLHPYCLCFLNQTGQNANLTAFTSKILVFCRPEWTKWDPHVNDIWQSLLFMSPSWVVILKLSKILSFFPIFADVSKKSKTVTAIYAYASESSRFALLENGISYYTMN